MRFYLKNTEKKIKTMKNNSSSVVKSCSDMIKELEFDSGLKTKK